MNPHDNRHRLDGFSPATGRAEEDFDAALLSSDMHQLLAVHHTTDGRHTYLLAYDQAAIWDVPGSPAFLSQHVTRDLTARTFTFDQRHHPLLPLAQNWLHRHGCPLETLSLSTPDGPVPADDRTRGMENRLRTDLHGRYTLVDHHTVEPVFPDHDGETWALLHDSEAGSAVSPYLLVVEDLAADLSTYRFREGSFADVDSARHWLATREVPPADTTADARAAAARSHTTLTSSDLPAQAPPIPHAPDHRTAPNPVTRPRRSGR
ncbi:hypothetical protein [Streptomyces sp. ST2-7A]|uniref:hypothetical protein n=1 Tax=Streptomyces sp. ST2-7A TaxID=2907214 RepID=UPI001F2B6C57|nr:hypothetical protein [Streptomyces sp. ST2-7A]MCE7080157.1 hypothetical protein [Streptomyces sp. ST2-7A]